MKILYTNGYFHTMCTEAECFTVMGTENDRIIYIGNELPDTAAGYSRRVSLEGMHVYPALTDSHVHLLNTAILGALCFPVCSIGANGVEPDCMEGVRERISGYVQQHPDRQLIVVTQYLLSAIRERRLPTCRELDEWTGGRMAVVGNIDGHSSSMSTALMEKMGIHCGNPDGYFYGEAHETVQGRVADLTASCITPSVAAKGLGDFQNLCALYGISRVCSMDGNEDSPSDRLTGILAFLAARMDIDVRLFPEFTDLKRASRFFRRQSTPRVGGCGSWELDGSVGSHSAAFYTKYRDREECGECYYEDAFVEELIRQAVEQKLQISCHAIGEKAIDQAVRAFERAGIQKKEGGPLSRIDHFEFPTAEAVEKIKTMPLALTIQPGFSWLDKRYLKSYEQFLQEDKIQQQLPLKELYDAGVCLCGSSDSPIQSINPFEQMLGMTQFYLEEQALSPYEAMCTYTTHAAEMLGESEQWGTLEPGKKADFMVLKEDFFKAEPGKSGTFHAEYMVKDGTRYIPKTGILTELAAMLIKKPHKL